MSDRFPGDAGMARWLAGRDVADAGRQATSRSVAGTHHRIDEERMKYPTVKTEESVWQNEITKQTMTVHWNWDDGARESYTGPGPGWKLIIKTIIETIDYQHPEEG